MINAEAINEYKREQAAKGIKLSYLDLTALSATRDPYYATKRPLKMAEWVFEHWKRLGYTSGIHPRRMYYALVDQVDSFRGEPFRNVDTNWTDLVVALSWARYLELIPEDSIVDHKNPHVQIFDGDEWGPPGWEASAEVRGQDDIDDIEIPEFPAKPSIIVDYISDLRPYRLEVWAEKSTMNDILVPLCESLKVNLQTFSGDGSLTRSHEFVLRARRAKRPTRIFYISDFDPNGWGMPSGIARKIQFENDRDDLGLDVRLTPIVLTPEQIDDFDLPSAPDSNTVELDALEALHPGELARIVEEAIKPYIDKKYEAQARRRLNAFRIRVGKVGSETVSGYEDEWGKLEQEWEELTDQFEEDVDDILSRRTYLAEDIEDDLKEAAKGIHGTKFSVDPRVDESDGDLFDSTRDYFEQNKYYQKRKAEKLKHFSKNSK